MCRRHLPTVILLGLLTVLAGCARTPAPDPMIPDASPVPGAQVEEPAYLEVAEGFVSAIQRGEPAAAHELLTDEAQETLPVEQFVEQMGELRPAGYNVMTHTASELAAYVLVGFESAEAVAPEAIQTPGMGLLLRPVDDEWRVSFFVPQSDPGIGLSDMLLMKTAEHQFTLTWSGPDGSPQSLTMTEF